MNRHSRPQPRLRLMHGILAAGLIIGLAACGDDDDDTANAATATTDIEISDGVLEVIAVDYGFEGIPERIEAGTRLRLRNDAPGELHELVAFRLDDDDDRSVEDIVHLPPEEMQAALGAPITVILAPPNSEQIAVPIGDGTLSEPGRYAIICMIPTGADPDEYLAAAASSDGPPDVGGGAPHIAHGMYAEVIVE